MTSEIIPDRLYIGDCHDGRLAHEDPVDYDEVIALASGDHDNTTYTYYMPDGGPRFDHDEHYGVFKDAVNTLRQHLAEGDTVLIHCNAGQSRAPSVSIAAIATLDNSSYEEAYNEVNDARPIVTVSPPLKECANRYIDAYNTIFHHEEN